MTVYIDGSGKSGRDGKSRTCVIIEPSIVNNQRQIMYDIIEGCTSNEAEYKALLRALGSNIYGTRIYTDSALLVGHLTKGWNRNSKFDEIFTKCNDLLLQKRCYIEWIPRKKNLAGKYIEDHM